MNTDFLIIGGVLLVLGYLVGIQKKTWLLAGFNEKRVTDKNKLAALAGGYTGVMGILFLIAGILSFEFVQGLFMALLVGYISLIVFVNVKMVE